MASAASGLFSGDNSKNITVQLDDTNKMSQEKTALSYNRVKGQLFKIINLGEKYNVLPEDASEESRDFLQSSKMEFQNLNLEEDIESFFNDISFDLDDNGDLDIKVAGNKDYFDKTAIKNYLSNNTELSNLEINGLITKWEQNLEKAVNKAEEAYAVAKQKAIVYSDKTAHAIAKYSIIAFFVFLLGAAAAIFGGATGSPEYILSREERLKINKV